MPLDQNLFTLSIHSRPDSIGWLDLVIEHSNGRDIERMYSAFKKGDTLSLLDPFTEALHGTVTTLAPKLKLIQLESPSLAIELKSTGLISWEYSFTYENMLFNWSREITSLIGSERGFTLSVSRKPEPSWPVTLFKSGKSSNKSSISIGSIQVLDYNYARLEPPIEDKKGLEIITILSLLSFTDHYFASSSSSSTSTTTAPALDPRSSAFLAGSTTKPLKPVPPILPAKINSSTSTSSSSKIFSPSSSLSSNKIDPLIPTVNPRISTVRKELNLSANELEIKESDSSIKLDEYTSKCLALFVDPSLLYLTLIARTGKSVSIAIKLAEEVKRKRYKVSAEELMQYILPLDDQPSSSTSTKYAAPTSIKIFLSRIALDELLPLYQTKKKSPSSKPDIRAPIVFGSNTHSGTSSNSGSGSGSVAGKGSYSSSSPTSSLIQGGKKLEDGKSGTGGLFGFFSSGGSSSGSHSKGAEK